MKTVTVSSIITKNIRTLEPMINQRDFIGATNKLNEILTIAADKGKINSVDYKKCIHQLTLLVNKPSNWLSTFCTWQLGGNYRVGPKKTY